MADLTTSTESGVTTITLNRPDAMNAFTPDLLEDLAAALKDAASSADCIVLTGAGRAFSAGVDLKVLAGVDPEAGVVGDMFDAPAAAATKAIRDASVPVIAKVHGACFTGALEIALHCDFIYTTDDTKFGDTHAKFGLRPTWGLSQLLPQAVGLRRARELSFTAATFSGADAARWGLANASFADQNALDTGVEEATGKIAANSRAAIAAYKDLYKLAAERRPLEDALGAETDRSYPDITDTAERLAGFGKK